jgi:hypothetical protein
MDYFYREKCLAYESGTAKEMPSKDKGIVLCLIENCPYGFYRSIGKINEIDEIGMCISGGYVDQRRKSLDKKISDHPKFIDLRKTEPKS